MIKGFTKEVPKIDMAEILRRGRVKAVARKPSKLARIYK